MRFTDATGGSFFIGRTWYRDANVANSGYEGEPPRALLFTTRTKARNVCREFRAANQKIGGVCARWRFTPVLIRERVTPVTRG